MTTGPKRILAVLVGGTIGLVLLTGLLAFAAYEKWFPFHRWHYIVIHHSASATGNAASFDEFHKRRGILGGLAYHFVIGNGRGSPNGHVEQGARWTAKRAGGHVTLKAWNYNVFGIGICLVGNFENGAPTSAQRQALLDLVFRLAKENGIPPENILGHTDTPWFWSKKATELTACPGRRLDIHGLRQQVRQRLAAL